MVTWKSLIGAAGLLGTVAANAVSPPPPGQPVDTAKAMLDRMDRNLDGKISFEEYRNAMVRRFGARDVNDDGVLEGDEFPKEWLAGAAVLPLVFDGFDADKDGQFNAAEIAVFAAARKTQAESGS
jgi:EF-hand domain pair